jgi:beta-glucosidase
VDARIEKWIGELGLEEKCALVAGADLWHTVGVPRLGIPALRVTDGPNGARGVAFRGGPTSACFPCGAAQGASFDPELVERIGAALAEEARSKGAGVLLAPTVNLQRTPLGGRDFECASEEPFLAARLAAAFVRGVQGRGVGACVKHFACNDAEWERHRASVEVDERTLREVYLAPFEAAVREAGAWSVMAAYNRLGGVHCTEHERLLTGILRDEWGFDGAVISDWFATQSGPLSLRAGMDLEMPGPPRHYGAKLAAAVREGRADGAALDRSVRRVLGLLARTGALDAAPGPPPERADDRPEHRALAREAAIAGIVLLRNERDALPDDPEGQALRALPLCGVRRLAVVGPNADRAVIQGGGSARVTPHYAVSPLAGLAGRAAAAGVELVFARGPTCYRTLPALGGADLEGALELELFAAEEPGGAPLRSERVRSGELFWLTPPAPIAAGARFAARLRARLRAREPGAQRLSLTSAGRARLRVDGRTVIDLWERRERGSAFFGLGSREVEVSIRLAAGASAELELDFAHDRPGLPAGLRIGFAPPEPADALEQAVAAARDADAAVVVVGLDEDWETEGRDRDGFALPGRQDELVAAVAAANPRTVVVVNAGSPVAMPWADAAAAIVQLWYPGQEGGRALAEVLFGDADPGGRLPLTIPRRLEDTPAWLDCPGDALTLRYAEGVFVGHRWYDARGIEPRFPFGHGLSYARFAYGALRLARDALRAGEPVVAEIEVANTGERPGVEVVQLYCAAPPGPLRRPPLVLVGFAKLRLAPGGRGIARFTVPARALASWDVAAGDWRVEPGSYELAAGRSSRDLRARARFTLD